MESSINILRFGIVFDQDSCIKCRNGCDKSTKKEPPGPVNDLASILRGIEGAANRIIANIAATRADILDSPGKVWDLDNVVGLTFGVLGLEEGSAAYRLIKAELESRAFGKMLRDVFLALVNIGLGILALSGVGTPIAILAGLGAAAASTTTYLIHLEEYNFQKAASGTGTSSETSLSSVEPDAMWLYLDLVGIGIDVFAVLKILSKTAQAAKAFKAATTSEELAARTRLLSELDTATRAMLPADDASKAITGIARNLDDAEHVKLIRSGENAEVLVKNEAKVVEGGAGEVKTVSSGQLGRVIEKIDLPGGHAIRRTPGAWWLCSNCRNITDLMERYGDVIRVDRKLQGELAGLAKLEELDDVRFAEELEVFESKLICA
jgi:hypothetical protein